MWKNIELDQFSSVFRGIVSILVPTKALQREKKWFVSWYVSGSYFTAGRQIYNLLSQPQFCRVRESNLLFSCCLLQFYKGATAGVRSVCKKLAKLRLVYLELRVIFDGFKKISRGGKVAFWRQTKS